MHVNSDFAKAAEIAQGRNRRSEPMIECLPGPGYTVFNQHQKIRCSQEQCRQAFGLIDDGQPTRARVDVHVNDVSTGLVMPATRSCEQPGAVCALSNLCHPLCLHDQQPPSAIFPNCCTIKPPNGTLQLPNQ